MDCAFDKVLQKVVSAFGATKAFNRFYCPNPNCREPVHLCDGAVQVKHFKHNKGVAKVECDLYTFNVSAQYYYSNFQHEDERTQLDRIGLEINVFESLNWKLSLRFPRCESNESGFLVAQIGPGDAGIQYISVQNLQPGTCTFGAIPCDDPLGAKSSEGMGALKYFERLSRRFVALSAVRATAFHANGFRGRLQTVGSNLYWGSSYFLVHKSGALLSLPPTIIEYELHQNNGWRATLVKLPVKASESLEQWLQRNTNLYVKQRSTEIELVFPTAWNVLPSAEIAVARVSELIVSVRRSGFVDPLDTLAIESASASYEYEYTDLPDGDLVVAITAGSKSDPYIFVKYGIEPGKLFGFRKMTETFLNPPLRLKVFDAGAIATAPFYSMRAADLLAAYRRREVSSLALLCSFPISGKLEWRMDGATKWEFEELASGVQLGSWWKVDISSLSIRLLDLKLEVRVDFGSCGVQLLPAQRRGQRRTQNIERAHSPLIAQYRAVALTDSRVPSTLEAHLRYSRNGSSKDEFDVESSR
jgi:hypothetical protein